MASLAHGISNFASFWERRGRLSAAIRPPHLQKGTVWQGRSEGSTNRRGKARCSMSESKEEESRERKTPFGYTRKDVLLIGAGVTATGVGLKSGLEFVGVDPLQAGNAVQLILVLGLTLGWISTYIFRVSNKEMTYARQLRDYETKVMQKRLESLSEAELEALLEQVDEDKRRLEVE